MKIDNRTKCCSTCKFWLWMSVVKYLVGEVEVDSPMEKSTCRCKYNMEGKKYNTQPLNICNFYEQSELLKWYDGDDWLSRKRRNEYY